MIDRGETILNGSSFVHLFAEVQHGCVAGGANRKTTGLPAWLVAANAETRRAAEEAMQQRRPGRRIHCWVHGSAADHPGLVLDWRRVGAGWMANVCWTTGDGDLVVTWVDAEAVSPLATRAASNAAE